MLYWYLYVIKLVMVIEVIVGIVYCVCMVNIYILKFINRSLLDVK